MERAGKMADDGQLTM